MGLQRSNPNIVLKINSITNEKRIYSDNLLAHEITGAKIWLCAGTEAPELILAAQLLAVKGRVWGAEEVVDPRVGDLTLVLPRVGGFGALPLALDAVNRGLNP